VKLLAWHVHGAWMTSFVHGAWETLVPLLPDRGPDGRGRARTYAWPPRAREVTPDELRDAEVDAVVLQRPHEERLAREWLGGRVPGRDLPMIYLEHNAPQGRIADMRHPVADRDDVTLVHVAHWNALYWDGGRTRTRVVEHGIVDPGERYGGDLARAAVVVNEPVRRGRVTGTDLLPRFARAAPLDLFGIGTEELGGHGDVPHDALLDAMARRRVYLHPMRWTSLGLSLLEAMHLGMPVVALAATEAPLAIPSDAGVVSCRLDVLERALRLLVAEPEAARAMGRRARAAALERYGLARFLADWDALLTEVAAS
jgi:hypothetical protein